MEENYRYNNKYLPSEEIEPNESTDLEETEDTDSDSGTETDTDADTDSEVPFDKDFFTDTSVYYIGSHNSFYLKDGDPLFAKHVWVLEKGISNFINQDETM